MELPFAESWKIKMVEPIRKSTRQEREKWIKEAHYNLFQLKADQVYIDCLTDSGTGAMSDRQWAAMMMGDESYAGSSSFFLLKDTITRLTGFEYVIPTHQGRAAENVLFSHLVHNGDIVPGNSHFDTTKGHIESRKAVALDCTVDEAKDTQLEVPFKGNVDPAKLETALKQYKDKIPFIIVTVTNNTAGGQPVSMQNLREVRALAEKYQDKIEILCGVEQDACSTAPTEGFDYVIGSVHYVEKNGMYYCVDESPEVLEQGIREGFGGDVYALTKRFFEIEAEVVSRTNATFIGHFDLVTKFNEGSRYFDPMDKRYRTAALSAMDALLETGRPFEINTGGMYRGLRTEPYPSLQLLRDLKERRGKILLSSDSHDGASLGFRFAEVAQAAKEIGFDSVLVLKKDGWEEFKLL